MKAVARSLMLMVLVGVLIAAAIIGGVNALEQGKVITGPSSSTVTSRTTVTTTTSNPLPTGILAAQITDPPDPPNVPAGTTHVYINYSDIEAATDQNGNQIWETVANAGTIDLLSVVNTGLTLGSAQVFSGTYSQARFDITNASVTFGGINYTASVPLNEIVVTLSNGGALVNPNSSAGFVLDISPTVLATNNGGMPSFEIVTAAQGLAIPSQSWNDSLATTGSTIQNIASESWWEAPTPIGDNLTVVRGSELYPTTLLVILNNTGSTPVTISALDVLTMGTESTQSNVTVSTSTIVSTITTTITEVTTITGTSNGGTNSSPADPQPSPSTENSSESTVATFLILTNGSVVQPNPDSAPIPQNQIGLTIKPYQVVVLFYFGPINALNSLTPPYAPQSIIGGQQYTIQIETPFGSSLQFDVNATYSS